MDTVLTRIVAVLASTQIIHLVGVKQRIMCFHVLAMIHPLDAVWTRDDRGFDMLGHFLLGIMLGHGSSLGIMLGHGSSLGIRCESGLGIILGILIRHFVRTLARTTLVFAFYTRVCRQDSLARYAAVRVKAIVLLKHFAVITVLAGYVGCVATIWIHGALRPFMQKFA